MLSRWQILGLVAIAGCGSVTLAPPDGGEPPNPPSPPSETLVPARSGGPGRGAVQVSTPDDVRAADAGASGEAGAIEDAGAASDGRVAVDARAGGEGGQGDASSADARPQLDAGTAADAHADGAADARATSCVSLLSLDRACAKDDDCAVVTRRTSCCGPRRAVGINKTAKPAFDPLEKACEATFGLCLCAPGPVVTDDGSTLTGGAKVACVNGACTSYVGACGKPCTGGATCQACTGGGKASFSCTATARPCGGGND